MIADHHLNRLLLEHSHSIQFSEVSEHDEKPQIIVERAHHASSHLQGHIHSAPCRQHLGAVLAHPATCSSRWINYFKAMRQLRLSVDFNGSVPWPNAPSVLLGHLEASVSHLQRATDALFHDDVQRLARYDFKDTSKNV
eukprot:Skav232623  [mRNA]  locus=scaffold12:39480:40346:- [translate_table: standard]